MIKYSDGVVDIYRNKTKEPYIIFETKRWGIGLEKALPQLKSYLANSLSAQYGIATDGNSIIIINKSGEIINDIPIFDSSMKWQLIEDFGVDSFVTLEDERLLFEYDFSDDDGMLAWMLSCGEKVTVLEPENVREKIFSIASNLVEKYGNTE